MRTRFLSIFSLVTSIALLTLMPCGTKLIRAQAPRLLPLVPGKLPCPFESCHGMDSAGYLLQKSPDGQWLMPDGSHLPVSAVDVTRQDTGGPDDFGYTWTDSVPLSWIDARTGTDTGLRGDIEVVGPVWLPFPFKFYENTYSQIYISKHGYAGFTNVDLARAQGRIPEPSTPNNIIAPYWVPSLVNEGGYTGKVYYSSGGAAPNRYFVIEWYQIRGDYEPDENVYTFELMLYENGDILLQHATMTYGSGWVCGHVGIEDSEGLDGLGYGSFCQQYASNKAIRFYRPSPSARVQARPAFHGRFARAGETLSFQQRIRNTGEMGTDTYDLFVSSSWTASIYAANGVTPLTDTDGDGVVDTGAVAQGGTAYITVRVKVPAGSVAGDDDSTAVTIRSSISTAKQRTATFQAAIPAPFAQVFLDNADGAQSFYLAQPAAQSTKKVTSDGYRGYDVAVAESPNRNFVYVWSKYREAGGVGLYEIEYALLNQSGDTVRAVSKLTDHGAATVNTYDEGLVTAVAPDGRIGMSWYRYLYNSSNSTWNLNIYYAILDASGNVVVPPTNLTNNPIWGYG